MKKSIIVATIIIVLVGILIWGGQRSVKTSPVSVEPESAPEVSGPSTPPPALQPEEKPLSKIKTIQGMKIETTKEGTGTEITNGKTAVVHYTGKLENGTVFDSSKTRGTPFEFPLGAGMVIKGWDLGVLGMKVGETRVLTIPAELGYGSQGVGGVIPPNATLIFEVELLAIK